MDKTIGIWNGRPVDNSRPLEYGGQRVAAVIGWSGIQVMDPGLDIVELCSEYAKAVKQYSCGQCNPCRTGTRALADLFAKISEGRGNEENLTEIEELSRMISVASMCEMGQSFPRVFIYLLENFRSEFINALNRNGKSDKTCVTKFAYNSMLTAPCMQACPIHLDIPKYIEEIKAGRFSESLQCIKSRLPLPGIVGRVCVRPCESNCRRGLIDAPLQIRHLKRFVADFERESLSKAAGTADSFKDRTEPKLSKVAIVGAGPSGLTCASFLAKKGYEVTIFEMLPESGGMAAVGIPDYRLPRDIVRDEVAEVERLGVRIVYGKALGPHFTLDDLENEGFRAVFIGMGCHCHKSLGIEGEDQSIYGYVPGVYFLRNINLGLLDEVPKGKKMVVVGGGNVAIDCVRTAFRVGFDESHIVYRRSRKEMPADPVEIDDAEAEGVHYHFLTAPKRIIGQEGKVAGLECLRMELGEPDASGRRRPVEVPGSEFVLDADVIVAAIGQEGDFNCMCNLPGVDVTKKGAIIVDENLMTSRKGVFAGGDCVTGPDVLIKACAHGRRVSLAIDRYLAHGSTETLAEIFDDKFINNLGVYDPNESIALPKGAGRVVVRHELPLERKHDFREVDKGYTSEEAVLEASRCLRCYRVVMYACVENGKTISS
ncbi:MAG TPA: FAD-dependent oxidoreductase [Dissulfurispiraceae bacterium]|nr:FAD-dependent oxidoreductase [Dissulfurispiraceae bacterium]